MTDKQSRHPTAASAASTKFASETLAGFDTLGIEPVVIGGWAVRLYGSPVFSIDLDILMRPWEQGEYEIYDFIHERTDHHKSAYEDSYLETKDFDEPNRLWVTGESFIPGELLKRYGSESRSVEADGYMIAALVPTPQVLAFMKVKAMLNRANKLGALRDRLRLVSLDEMDREQIEGISEDFMVRKVAKDIANTAGQPSLRIYTETTWQSAVIKPQKGHRLEFILNPQQAHILNSPTPSQIILNSVHQFNKNAVAPIFRNLRYAFSGT